MPERRFKTIKDYHAQDATIDVRCLAYPSVDVSLAHEPPGEVSFRHLARNTMVVDVAGSRAHLTQMDGTLDERPLQPGDVLFVPAGAAVRLAWTPLGSRQDCISVEFDQALFALYAPEIVSDGFDQGHLVSTHYHSQPHLAALARLLARELDPELRRGPLFAQSVIRVLALEIATIAWSRAGRRRDGAAGGDARVGHAIDYIEAHFASNISLLDLAAAAALSPTQLNAMFRRHTGRSPYAYVVDRRVDAATQLLRDTDTPIAQVAVAVGFSDQSHLTRQLRARLGRTPAALRRS